MGMRSGRVKGPYVGPAGAGGGTPSNLTPVPTWIKFSVTHAQLQAAALTNSVELYSAPSRFVLSGVIMKPTIKFAGPGFTAYNLGLGLVGVGNLEKYLLYSDVFVNAVSDTNFFTAGHFPFSENWGAVTSVRATAQAVGANLSVSTAGAADYWLLLSRPLA